MESPPPLKIPTPTPAPAAPQTCPTKCFETHAKQFSKMPSPNSHGTSKYFLVNESETRENVFLLSQQSGEVSTHKETRDTKGRSGQGAGVGVGMLRGAGDSLT